MTVVGIYKITSPSNRIYVGQSWNIPHRWRSYTCKQNRKGQRILAASLSKYGHAAHKFEVIHELPHDVTQEVLDNYEQLYIDAYKDTGAQMMNIKGGGSKGKLAEETKRLLSIAHSGKTLSEEHKQRLREKRHSEDTKKLIGDRQRGRKYSDVSKQKMSAWQVGRKFSEETKEKIALSKIGKKHSEEHKQKIRNKLKGKTFSEERNRKVSAALTGKIRTDEHKANLSKSAIESGRALGMNNPKCKLTEDQVKQIRQMYVPGLSRNDGRKTLRDIAKEFGVGRTAIADIVSGKKWSHVA